MKRALFALVVVAGCAPSVILGTLSTDGGNGDMLCVACDLGRRDGPDLSDGGPDLSDGFDSGFGSADLGPHDM